MKGFIKLDVITDGVITNSVETTNTVCNAGLNQLVAYLGNLPSNGIAINIYGAVGSGLTAPTVSDVTLTYEMGRAQMTAGGSNGATLTWSTVIPNLSGSTWTINEGGSFIDAGQAILTTLSAAASASATSVTVASAQGINVGSNIVINPYGTIPQTVSVTAISGNVLTISPALVNAQLSGVSVYVVTGLLLNHFVFGSPISVANNSMASLTASFTL